jgi:tetratricopeptide (TPR) repeat protein
MRTRHTIGLLLVLILSGVTGAQVSDDREQAGTRERVFDSSDQDPNRSIEYMDKLRYAASQHEIISILIEEGEYNQVITEFAKILELGLSGSDERLVVKEALIVASRLIESQQYSVAHEVVDEALEITQQRENRFSLIMMKGKVFKEEGKLKQALNAYRRAQKIQH